MTPETLLEAALAYAADGLAVLPVWWTDAAGKCACGRTAGDDDCKPGKHPLHRLVPRGVSNATTDLETLRAWWQQYPQANIGIAGGPASQNLLWLDFDKRAEEIFPKWRAAAGSLADTLPIVKTGQGYRVAFRMADEVEAKSNPNIARDGLCAEFPKGAILIETKGKGGYGIAPPSLHPSGVYYEQIQGDLFHTPTLCALDAITLIDVARAFNAYVPPPPPIPTRSYAPAKRVLFEDTDKAHWESIWERLDLPALDALLPELQPAPAAGYLGRMRCPQCGKSEAFIYPSNGTQGVSIRCSRQNKCAFHKTLFKYLEEREGSTETAHSRLCEVTGTMQTFGRVFEKNTTKTPINFFKTTRAQFSARRQPTVKEIQCEEPVYTGEYWLIEDLAAQNLLPCRFQAVPDGRVVDLNVKVREAFEAKDAARLDQLEALFEKWRAPYMTASPK